MGGFDSLAKAISWLDAQGGFTQGVVTAAVLGLSAGSWTFAKWVVRKLRERMTDHQAIEDQKARQLADDFQKGTAEPGIVDHGVNTTASVESIRALFDRAMLPLTSIFENLYRDTPGKLPEKDDPHHAFKKQAVLKQAAQEIHPHVLALESVPEEIAAAVSEFIEAYRALLRQAAEQSSDVERQTLIDLKATYGGGAADTFRMLASIVGERRKSLSQFQGKQQDLTRMVRRAIGVLQSMQASAGRFADFCSKEMPKTIDKILASMDDRLGTDG